VIDFRDAVRLRVKRMAAEQTLFSDMLPRVPAKHRGAFLAMMEHHAEALSQLAGMIENSEE